MTLMTNDLNDHFFSRRSLAKTEGDPAGPAGEEREKN